MRSSGTTGRWADSCAFGASAARRRRRRSSPCWTACRGLPRRSDADEACRRFELPPDREGDVAVIGEPDVVIGAAASEHDLSTLGDERLRSHGAVAEAQVPFILSRPLNAAYRHRAAAGTLKSHQIFDYAINGTERGAVNADLRPAGSLRTTERAVPGPSSTRCARREPGEVLVRVRMSTICRSDIHSYQGHRPNPCPGVLGHEIIGVIEALGAGVAHDMRGDPLDDGRPDHLERVLHPGPQLFHRGARPAAEVARRRQVRPHGRSNAASPPRRLRRVLLRPAAIVDTAPARRTDRRRGHADQLRRGDDDRRHRGRRHPHGPDGGGAGARACSDCMAPRSPRRAAPAS